MSWCSTDRRLWLVCFGICLVVLGATAHWYGLVHIDTQAADWGAWQLVHHRTLDLRSAPHLPGNPLFVHVGERLLAGRTPGVLLIGTPFQLLLAPFSAAPETAGALAAVVVTSLGTANFALLARRLGADPRGALAAALVLAFGTPVWTVAGAELWTHGPDLLWLSLALLAAERGAWLGCGLAFSAALWTRPHLAVVAASVAGLASLRRRAWRPVVLVGATTAVAVLSLVGWNTLVYGHPSISGGYYSYVTGRATATSTAATTGWLRNVLFGTVSPLRGFVLYTPIVLPALWAGLRSWRCAPDWARGALVGGLLYLLVQWHVNDYQGGTNFFGNRLVIEPLALGFPLCVWGYVHGHVGPRARIATRLAAALSVTTFATGSLLAFAPPNSFDTQGAAWRHWPLLDDVRSMHGLGWGVLLASAALSLAVALRRPAPQPRNALIRANSSRTGQGAPREA